jgi:hypothetical protein
MSNSTSVRFLDPKEESIMIALPWIGAFLTVGLWVFELFGKGWQINPIHLFITGVIFLDGVHIVFSLVLFAGLPELRNWDREKSFRPILQIIGAATGFVILFYFLKVNPMTATLTGVAATFLILDIVGPAQHTVAQMKGISLCFNSSIHMAVALNEVEKKNAALNDRIERLLFGALLASEILYNVPNFFTAGHLGFPEMDRIKAFGRILAIASASGLVINAFYFPYREQTRKVSYLCRTFLFALKNLTPVGLITLRAAHGSEYLSIFRRMVQGSKISREKRIAIYTTTIILSAGVAVMLCSYMVPNLIRADEWSPSVLTGILVSMFALRYTHYFMDSIMFKMSDPLTRANMGPLLAPVTPLQVSSEESSIIPASAG